MSVRRRGQDAGHKKVLLSLIRSGEPLTSTQIDAFVAVHDPDIRLALAESSHPLTRVDEFLVHTTREVSLAFLKSNRPVPPRKIDWLLMTLWRSRRDSTYCDVLRVALVESMRPLTGPQIKTLARDFCPAVRAALAGSGHPLTHPQIKALARDPSADVRAALAGSGHPLTHPQIKAFATDSDKRCRDAAFARIGVDPIPRSQWAKALASESVPLHAKILIVTATRDKNVIATAGMHPNSKIRLAVISNPKVTGETLALLADDPNLKIRTAVQARLLRAVS